MKTEASTDGITRRDLMAIFLRGMLLQLSWNFERMQGLGYCYCILPILKKLYRNDPDALKKAVKRNMEFFNTTPYMALPILGISIAMEERLAKKGDIDGSSISSVKLALMGPLGGVGDSLFWYTLIPICAGIGVSLSADGSLLGPVVFLVMYNIFTIAVRWFGVAKGYALGAGMIDRFSDGVIKRITEGASIVGLMVVGVMTATNVEVPLELSIGQGDAAKSLTDILNGIMPNLIPLLLVWGIYMLTKKGVSATKLMLGIIVGCVALAYMGVF